MSAAVLEQILETVVTLAQNASLTGIASNNVQRRMLPKVDETIDPLPAVFVCPNPRIPEKVTRLSFENDVQVEYGLIVCVIAANNRDFVSQLATYLTWRENLRTALGAIPLQGVPAVWDMQWQPEKTYDLGLLNENYFYAPLLPVYWSHETRF